jgi:hypothetical protein
MKILNNLKRKFTLMRDDLEYIEKCQNIYKSITGSKKKTMIDMSQRHLTRLKPCGS